MLVQLRTSASTSSAAVVTNYSRRLLVIFQFELLLDVEIKCGDCAFWSQLVHRFTLMFSYLYWLLKYIILVFGAFLPNFGCLL